ncbi:N-acylneuraminate cytidylyltransferase A-like [Panonychus citri]|uniref:N-acylneuraminate cytidylyltransferase A-like n=1 Tax=Panonychus citri TaxID=50023 RepID=UPI0023075139|nr:N-acylneuraminate cytidylyltransferase A-like [Panonychus citri]
MKHFALILARSGSKSIRDKNIFPINGLPLIAYCLKVLDCCHFLDDIWVSTDDQRIADVSQSISPRVKINYRSQSSSQDKCSSIDSVKDFLVSTQEFGVIYLIQCTSPCLKINYIKQAYDLINSGSWDSVFSVTKSHHLRWSVNCDQSVSPLNFNPQQRPRRQDWPGDLIESGHFYVAKTKLILEKNLLQSESKSTIVEIPNCMSLELDELWQIPFIELMIKLHYEDPQTIK